MNAQVGKWGNSLAVRLPGTYVKELHLTDANSSANSRGGVVSVKR